MHLISTDLPGAVVADQRGDLPGRMSRSMSASACTAPKFLRDAAQLEERRAMPVPLGVVLSWVAVLMIALGDDTRAGPFLHPARVSVLPSS